MTASLYDIPVTRMDGSHAPLAAYRGKVVLIVNVASQCGLTPQYTGLEALYQSRQAQGLEVLGFPANNFHGQEPGSDAEIRSFCTLNYGVQFPMFSKISVRGDDQHPLYAFLTNAQPGATGDGPLRSVLERDGIATGEPAEVLWNFEKFLVDRQGRVVARFAPDVAPDDARLVHAIDQALAQQG